MRIKVVKHLVTMVKEELSAQDQSFKEVLSQVQDNQKKIFAEFNKLPPQNSVIEDYEDFDQNMVDENPNIQISKNLKKSQTSKLFFEKKEKMVKNLRCSIDRN